MAKVNTIAFVVLKILCNRVFKQKFFLQITADKSKISKSVQNNITFIFNVLAEPGNDFM